MYEVSVELTVILNAVWWLLNLGKDWQWVNKQHRGLTGKDWISESYELKVRKQSQIEITNRFGALVNWSDGEDINRAWESIKDDIKSWTEESLGLQELKWHKARFDEKCLGFLDQRKQAKMKWVQDTSQSNANNLNNVRCEATVHFRNKKEVYLKAIIEELETIRKIKKH